MLVWSVVLIGVVLVVAYFANFGRAKQLREDRLAEIQQRLKEKETESKDKAKTSPSAEKE